MTLTKMECPNCHGTLEIPEGMKEGFVTCEYCKTKVYIEPSISIMSIWGNREALPRQGRSSMQYRRLPSLAYFYLSP